MRLLFISSLVILTACNAASFEPCVPIHAKGGRSGEDCITYYRRALLKTPDSACILRNLAVCATNNGNYDVATEALIKLEAVDPGYEFHHNYGVLLYKQKKLEEARKHFTKATEIEKHGIDYYYLARIAKQQNKDQTPFWEAAAKYYPADLAEDPSDAATWYDYGKTAEIVNQYEKAERAYSRVIALDPGHADAAKRLPIVRRKQQDAGSATPPEERIDAAAACRGDAAIAFVIDKSGSSGESAALKVSKSVAEETLRVLPAGSEVSVVAFDSNPFIVIKRAELTAADRTQVTKRLRLLHGVGKTNPLPAIEEAGRLLAASPAKCKSLIFLSDGSIEKGLNDLESVAAKLNRAGVVTSVGIISMGRVAPAFQSMAKAGNGFYLRTGGETFGEQFGKLFP